MGLRHPFSEVLPKPRYVARSPAAFASFTPCSPSALQPRRPAAFAEMLPTSKFGENTNIAVPKKKKIVF